MPDRRLDVCVIGMGPRGLSVLERICTNGPQRAPGARITVHVVDPYPPGAGRVWRTTQAPNLLMNTVASQVTLFTDYTVDLQGLPMHGPSLYEWARFLTLMGPFDGRSYPEAVLAEARELGPDSYPSRAFYGHYLRWVYRRVLRAAQRHEITIVTHRSKAVALDDMAPGGRQRVELEDGSRIENLNAVVLTLGHLPTEPDARETALAEYAAEHQLTYLPPANPADVDLSRVLPGRPVILLGLGLNFFDYMALLTEGRGGVFERVHGRLVYRPSGREPLLIAGSRRGLPFHARGENEKGRHGRHTPLVLRPEVVADLQRRAAGEGGLDFREHLWPMIAKEVEGVYYTTLLASWGRDPQDFRRRYLDLPWGDPGEGALLEEFGIGAAPRWDWDRVSRPHAGREFQGPADFRAWLLEYLRGDAAEAAVGNVSSPLKAALDVLRDLRNEVRLIVDHGGLTGRSHREDLERWYTPLNAFLSIGPPARRIEEVIALIEAGLCEMLGPDARAEIDEDREQFVAWSPAVPGSRRHAAALIDARLPDMDIRRTADPLIRYLMSTGQARPFQIANPGGGAYQTGGLEVGRRPYHLIDGAGHPHPRRFAFGVPTEAVHWVTAAGIRPGVNSVILCDTDAVARAVFAVADSDLDADPTNTPNATPIPPSPLTPTSAPAPTSIAAGTSIADVAVIG